MTPDEMRDKASAFATIGNLESSLAIGVAAELCARLDALVAVGERIAKALDERMIMRQSLQFDIREPK